MPHPELIITTSLPDEIAFRLQVGIIDGTYPPGTHLIQDELCERFGVSRTPVREALRKLQAQQLVTVIPNKGATVRAPSRQDLIDVYAVRGQLEGWACELAASRVNDDLINQLDSCSETIETIFNPQAAADAPIDGEVSQIQLARANEAFHSAIAQASGNGSLQGIIVDLERFFPPKDAVWRAIHAGAESYLLNVEEHRRIREALLEADGSRARDAMQQHIAHAGRLLLEYLDSHDFWT